MKEPNSNAVGGIYFDPQESFHKEVLNGLKSIDTNLNLILKVLTKPKKKKNASK